MKVNFVNRSSKCSRRKAMSYFKQYCDYTGIHGFRYIAEDRTFYERIWWIIALGLSMVLCSLMIYQIFQKYISYPIIVTFSMQETPVTYIPFPAVTICPHTKISQDYFNVTDAIIKKNRRISFHGETEKVYNIASAICSFFPTQESNNGTSSSDFYDFLEQSVVDIFYFCQYGGEMFNCSEHFLPVLTEAGLCFTYNTLDKTNLYHDNVYYPLRYYKTNEMTMWDIENGYGSEYSVDVYPRRVFGYGVNTGLRIILKTKISDIEHDCSPISSGYMVTLHLPSKIPEVMGSHILVPLNQTVTGQITSQMIKTSAGVKAFKPITRDCYFQSERSLTFFKIYTQENCVAECKTNFVLDTCGCVGFYMPRYNDTPVCILDDKECLLNAEIPSITRTKTLANCDCLPTCTDLTYNLETSQDIFSYKPQDEEMKIDLEGYELSLLNLYFKRNQIETKERNELYGFSDFISNFGGLLGFFTGFSMLSFIEIIYFLSLRIWGNIKLYKNWSGECE